MFKLDPVEVLAADPFTFRLRLAAALAVQRDFPKPPGV